MWDAAPVLGSYTTVSMGSMESLALSARTTASEGSSKLLGVPWGACFAILLSALGPALYNRSAVESKANIYVRSFIAQLDELHKEAVE